MTLNPELRRYLWVDATPVRLLGVVAVLGALFVVAWVVGQQTYTRSLPWLNETASLAALATLAFYVVTLGWGTRRAASALAEEIREHTWDGQRMSALGAWSMVWGKLAGATALTWVGALLCLAVYAAVEVSAGVTYVELAEIVGLRIGVGLVAQVIAFAAALLWLRKRGGVGRVPTLVCQFLGIGIGIALSTGYGQLSDAERVFGAHVFWYGFAIDRDRFILAGLAAALVWGLVAAYREMRLALQFRNRPWVWLLFMGFLMAVADGFLYPTSVTGEVHTAIWLSVPLCVAAALTYGTLFSEPKDVVGLRGFLAAVGRGQGERALERMPLWLVGMLVTVGLIAAMIAVVLSDPLPGGSRVLPVLRDTAFRVPGLVAILCFLVRDWALILGLTLGAGRRAGDILALVALVLLYALGGWIVAGLGAEDLMPIVRPQFTGDVAITIVPAVVQALLALMFLAGRWRAVTRPFRAAV